MTPVAPLVGAWIEIIISKAMKKADEEVAPLVGAWIEIVRGVTDRNAHTSLLSWERGLKCAWFISYFFDSFVAPLVGAWIEITPL